MNCQRRGNYRRFISERNSSEESQKCSCDWTENGCGAAGVTEHRKPLAKRGWKISCSSAAFGFLVDDLGDLIVSAFAQGVDEVLDLSGADVDRDAVLIVDSNLSAVDITMDIYSGVRCLLSPVNSIVRYRCSRENQVLACASESPVEELLVPVRFEC